MLQMKSMGGWLPCPHCDPLKGLMEMLEADWKTAMHAQAERKSKRRGESKDGQNGDEDGDAFEQLYGWNARRLENVFQTAKQVHALLESFYFIPPAQSRKVIHRTSMEVAIHQIAVKKRDNVSAAADDGSDDVKSSSPAASSLASAAAIASMSIPHSRRDVLEDLRDYLSEGGTIEGAKRCSAFQHAAVDDLLHASTSCPVWPQPTGGLTIDINTNGINTNTAATANTDPGCIVTKARPWCDHREDDANTQGGDEKGEEGEEGASTDDSYSGDVDDEGRAHGWGSLLLKCHSSSDGGGSKFDCFLGSFAQNRPVRGRILRCDGSTYKGEVDRSGRPHGWGVDDRGEAGGRFEGHWSSGRWHGWGRLSKRAGSERWEGQFEMDQLIFGMKWITLDQQWWQTGPVKEEIRTVCPSRESTHYNWDMNQFAYLVQDQRKMAAHLMPETTAKKTMEEQKEGGVGLAALTFDDGFGGINAFEGPMATEQLKPLTSGPDMSSSLTRNRIRGKVEGAVNKALNKAGEKLFLTIPHVLNLLERPLGDEGGKMESAFITAVAPLRELESMVALGAVKEKAAVRSARGWKGGKGR